MNLEDRIRKNIEKAKELGYKLKEAVWVDPKTKECCALGACLVGEDYETDDRTMFDACVQELLSMSHDAVRAFTWGFDNDDVSLLGMTPLQVQYFKMGQKFRAENLT